MQRALVLALLPDIDYHAELTDLRSERDALDQQCHILDGLADVARISVSPRDKRR